MKTVFLLCLLFLVSIFTHGQGDSAEVKDFIYLDLGGSANTCRDELVSPLRYSGFHSTVRFGYERRSEFMNWSVNLLFTQGSLGSVAPTVQREQIPSLERYQLNLNYDFKLPALSLKKWNFTIGPELQTTVVYRENDEFDNASFTFDEASILAVSATANRVWEKQKRSRSIWFLKWEQKPHTMQWNNRISSGFFGQASRPSYQTIIEYTGENQNVFDVLFQDENTFFGSVDRVFSFNTNSSLSWQFFNGNELHITYNWSYYRLQNKTQEGRNTSEGSMNNLGIAFYFALFKNEKKN